MPVEHLSGNVQKTITRLKLLRKMWAKYINLAVIHKGRAPENWHKVKRAEGSDLHTLNLVII